MSKAIPRLARVRALAEREQAGAIGSDAWDWLQAQGYLEDVSSGDMPDDEAAAFLVRELRRLRAAGAAASPVRERAGRMQTAARPIRADALSDVMAAEAGRRADVADFRTAALAGGLLPWGEVVAWVEARRPAKPTRWLTATVPEGTPWPAPRDAGRRIETLAYAAHDSEWVQRLATEHGTELERLRILGERLASAYGWQPAQATTFVLTGLAPAVDPVRITVHEGSRPTTQRIVLDVDPAQTPEDVAAAYRATRKAMISKRHRDLSEKMYELAMFVDPADTRPWQERLTQWNERFPQWAYPTSSYKNFHRDANASYRRLTGPLFA